MVIKSASFASSSVSIFSFALSFYHSPLVSYFHSWLRENSNDIRSVLPCRSILSYPYWFLNSSDIHNVTSLHTIHDLPSRIKIYSHGTCYMHLYMEGYCSWNPWAKPLSLNSLLLRSSDASPAMLWGLIVCIVSLSSTSLEGLYRGLFEICSRIDYFTSVNLISAEKTLSIMSLFLPREPFLFPRKFSLSCFALWGEHKLIWKCT